MAKVTYVAQWPINGLLPPFKQDGALTEHMLDTGADVTIDEGAPGVAELVACGALVPKVAAPKADKADGSALV